MHTKLFMLCMFVDLNQQAPATNAHIICGRAEYLGRDTFDDFPRGAWQKVTV
jgi:hypothetical protein